MSHPELSSEPEAYLASEAETNNLELELGPEACADPTMQVAMSGSESEQRTVQEIQARLAAEEEARQRQARKEAAEARRKLDEQAEQADMRLGLERIATRVLGSLGLGGAGLGLA